MTTPIDIRMWTLEVERLRALNKHREAVEECRRCGVHVRVPFPIAGDRTAPYYLAMQGREHETGEFMTVMDWRVK